MKPTVEWLTCGSYAKGVRLMAIPLFAPDNEASMKDVKYVIKDRRYYIRYKIGRDGLAFNTDTFMARGHRVMPQEAFCEEPLWVPLFNWFDMPTGEVDAIGARAIGIFRPSFIAGSYGSSAESIFSMHEKGTWYKLYQNRRNYDILREVRRKMCDIIQQKLKERVTLLKVPLLKSMVGSKDSNDAWGGVKSALETVSAHLQSWRWNDGINLRPAYEDGLLTPEEMTVELAFDKKFSGSCGYTCSWKFIEVGSMDDFLEGKFKNMDMEPGVSPEEILSRVGMVGDNAVKGNGSTEALKPLTIDGKKQVQLMVVTTKTKQMGANEEALSEEEMKWKKMW